MSSLMAALDAKLGPSLAVDEEADVPYWLPTSLPNLNYVLSDSFDGAAGVPGGRLISISGPASSGKTALMTELMIQGQRQGGIAALQDFEYAFMQSHAERQGLDPAMFRWERPISAENGMDAIFKLMRSMAAIQSGFGIDALDKLDATPKDKGPPNYTPLYDAVTRYGRARLAPLVCGLDSIAAMTPREQDVTFERQNMRSKNMSLPAMLSLELKRMMRDASRFGATIVTLNQLRRDPGVTFGDNIKEPGGEALAFYASIRIRLRKRGKVYASWGDKDSQPVGDIVEAYVMKNKVARPFRKTSYVFNYTDPVGLDLPLTMIVLGKEAGALGSKGLDSKTVNLGSKQRRVDDLVAECRTDKAVLAHLVSVVLPAITGDLKAEHRQPVGEAADEDEAA